MVQLTFGPILLNFSSHFIGNVKNFQHYMHINLPEFSQFILICFTPLYYLSDLQPSKYVILQEFSYKFYDFDNRHFLFIREVSQVPGSQYSINLEIFLQYCIKNGFIPENTMITGIQESINLQQGEGTLLIDSRLIFQEKNITKLPSFLSSSAISTSKTLFLSPSFSLFFQFAALVRIIDDLSYYRYHRISYDRITDQITSICWNITNGKYVLPQLKQIYNKFGISYESILPTARSSNTPRKFIQLDKNVQFVRRMEDYWLNSVPASVGIFVSMNLLQRFATYLTFFRVSNFLQRFGWFPFLIVNLIGENVQYLAFRSFSQLYQQSCINKTELFGRVLSYIVMFLVLFYACCIYSLLPMFVPKKLIFQIYYQNSRSIIHFTLLLLMRFVNAGIHSLLYFDSTLQISFLSVVQVSNLIILAINHKIYKKKLHLLFNVYEGVFRVVVHCILVVETQIHEIASYFQDSIQILLVMIFGLCIGDVIASNLPQKKQQDKKSKQSQNLQAQSPHIQNTKEIPLTKQNFIKNSSKYSKTIQKRRQIILKQMDKYQSKQKQLIASKISQFAQKKCKKILKEKKQMVIFQLNE